MRLSDICAGLGGRSAGPMTPPPLHRLFWRLPLCLEVRKDTFKLSFRFFKKKVAVGGLKVSFKSKQMSFAERTLLEPKKGLSD
jgi:hypothetical protein